LVCSLRDAVSLLAGMVSSQNTCHHKTVQASKETSMRSDLTCCSSAQSLPPNAADPYAPSRGLTAYPSGSDRQYRLPPCAGDPRGSLPPPQLGKVHLEPVLAIGACQLHQRAAFFINLAVQHLQIGKIGGKQILNHCGCNTLYITQAHHHTRKQNNRKV